MPLVFFDKQYPVVMLSFNDSSCYFKLKQLAKALRVPITSITRKTPPRYLITFGALLQQYPDCKHRHHPYTMFIQLEGVKYVYDECCATQYKRECLDKFVRRNVSVPSYNRLTSDYTFEECSDEVVYVEDDEEDDVELPPVRFGTLKQQVRFVVVLNPKKKWYYKASDVINLINASCSYNLSKHVDDKNVVVWKDLRNYLEDKFRCTLNGVDWKPNVLLLKQAGLKQLLYARNQQPLYSGMCLSAINYDFENPTSAYVAKKRKKRTRKLLFADECEMGKKHGRIDYIRTPNGVTWYKFSQLIKYYRLKNVNRDQYKTTRWGDILCDLARHNIKWKTDVLMIEGSEVYRLLQQYGLQQEADDIYFKKFDSKS
ncbi:bro [Spodoptera frugiperda granulovirus]|uniref:Bro n=1 Tax=Spodoptera frugiperda granulovirus TaxID=307454 RepID=A0A0C5B362_9BBAC|nr:bro [Spodoptera frugiperda granulovirus]AJK91755.1 bro [Spodoptera frugiperda granulovirus]AXS01118.1 bro-f [Spodoptera frugiperda granulovirus]